MAQLTMQHVIEAIGKMGRRELEEIAVAYALSHGQVCEIAGHAPSEQYHGHGSAPAEHRHAREQEVRERIGSMTTEELAGILAPIVLVVRRVDQYLT